MASSEQIADFVAFSCGASVEDATKFLGLTNSVEEAVNLYFTSQDNTSSSATTSTTQAVPNDQDYGFTYDDDDDVAEEQELRAAIPAKRQRLYDPSVSSSGGYLPGIQTSHIDKPTTSVFATGCGEKTSTQEVLAKLYAPPFDLMFPGNFDELRYKAKEANKWILVNIQKEEEFSTHVLNRDVWSNDSVKEILKYGFMFWQKHDTTSSAVDFFQIYKITPNDTTFPFIAILDPITKSLIKQLKNLANIPEACKLSVLCTMCIVGSLQNGDSCG
jgi:UBX domain-containing protein 7